MELAKLFSEIGTVDYGEDGDFNNWNWKDGNGNSLLHFAAYRGRVSDVLHLVEQGANVNSTNNFLETPLHRATIGLVIECRLEIIKNLIDNGADPYAKDKDGDTFLHTFLLQAETPPSPALLQSLVMFLIEKSILEVFNRPGGESEVTPLHLAVNVLEPEEDTLMYLCANGVDFNKTDKEGDSVLGYAVRGRRGKEFLSKLIKDFGADPGQLNHKDESLLHIAVQEGHLKGLKFFLGLGGGLLDVNGRNASGFTPLHVAVNLKENGQAVSNIISNCKLLIKHGADLDSETNLQETPLHLAAIGKDKKACLKVVEFLIKQGADVYSKDNLLTFLHLFIMQPDTPTPSEFHSMAEFLIGNNYPDLFNIRRGIEECTPLQAALGKLEPEERTLDLLYNSKVDFNEVDRNGGSVLFYAIDGKRSLALLSALINRFHVDWKAINSNGNSLLHYVAQFGTPEALKYVLELGGLDVNGKDGDGDTPLHCAVAAYVEGTGIGVLPQKCKLLLEHGANKRERNNAGETPRKIAKGKGLWN